MTTVYSTQHKHAKICFAFQVTLLAQSTAQNQPAKFLKCHNFSELLRLPARQPPLLGDLLIVCAKLKFRIRGKSWQIHPNPKNSTSFNIYNRLYGCTPMKVSNYAHLHIRAFRFAMFCPSNLGSISVEWPWQFKIDAVSLGRRLFCRWICWICWISAVNHLPTASRQPERGLKDCFLNSPRAGGWYLGDALQFWETVDSLISFPRYEIWDQPQVEHNSCCSQAGDAPDGLWLACALWRSRWYSVLHVLLEHYVLNMIEPEFSNKTRFFFKKKVQHGTTYKWEWEAGKIRAG